MDFQGHILYKMGTNWVFDLTDCIGYKVYKGKRTGLVQRYEKAFQILIYGSDFNITYNKPTPFGIVKRAVRIIYTYNGFKG